MATVKKKKKRLLGCTGVINENMPGGRGEGQFVPVNKRNTSTNPEVVAARIQDHRNMKVEWSVVVRLSAPRSITKDSTYTRRTVIRLNPLLRSFNVDKVRCLGRIP